MPIHAKHGSEIENSSIIKCNDADTSVSNFSLRWDIGALLIFLDKEVSTSVRGIKRYSSLNTQSHQLWVFTLTRLEVISPFT